MQLELGSRIAYKKCTNSYRNPRVMPAEPLKPLPILFEPLPRNLQSTTSEYTFPHLSVRLHKHIDGVNPALLSDSVREAKILAENGNCECKAKHAMMQARNVLTPLVNLLCRLTS